MSNLNLTPPNKSYNRFGHQIRMSLHQMRAVPNPDTKSGYCTTMKADKQSTIAHSIKMVTPSDFHTWPDSNFSDYLQMDLPCRKHMLAITTWSALPWDTGTLLIWITGTMTTSTWRTSPSRSTGGHNGHQIFGTFLNQTLVNLLSSSTSWFICQHSRCSLVKSVVRSSLSLASLALLTGAGLA